MIPLICGVANGWPLVIELEVRVNDGSLGSASYGSGGRLMGGPLVFSQLAVCQEVGQHVGAESQRVDGYPLVDAVEQRGEVQIRRQP